MYVLDPELENDSPIYTSLSNARKLLIQIDQEQAVKWGGSQSSAHGNTINSRDHKDILKKTFEKSPKFWKQTAVFEREDKTLKEHVEQ